MVVIDGGEVSVQWKMMVVVVVVVVVDGSDTSLCEMPEGLCLCQYAQG